MSRPLRDTLYPLGSYEDSNLWDAVWQVHLAVPVCEGNVEERFAVTSLYINVEKGGKSFSAGFKLPRCRSIVCPRTTHLSYRRETTRCLSASPAQAADVVHPHPGRVNSERR